MALAKEALKLHRFSAVDLDDVQAEIQEEMAVLAALVLRQKRLQRKNCALYQKLDPGGLLRSLPGIGEVLAPAFLALAFIVEKMGASRQLRSYAGFVPQVSASGQSERKGTRMTKAGPAWPPTSYSSPRVLGVRRKVKGGDSGLDGGEPGG